MMLDKGTRIPVRVVEPSLGTRSPSRQRVDPSVKADEAQFDREALFRKRQKKDDVDWKSVAARLQADMVNFRKRQVGRADDEVLREKMRLLREFLTIVDQFEAILEHVEADDPVHAGVQIAYDTMLMLLEREGVERIMDTGHTFDPSYHEAVAQANVPDLDVSAGTIVEVVQAGYTLKEQLLRPTKVVVSV